MSSFVPDAFENMYRELIANCRMNETTVHVQIVFDIALYPTESLAH